MCLSILIYKALPLLLAATILHRAAVEVVERSDWGEEEITRMLGATLIRHGPPLVSVQAQRDSRSGDNPSSRNADLVSSSCWGETPPAGEALTVTVTVRFPPFTNLASTLV